MPERDRDHKGLPVSPSASSDAEALTDDALIDLELDALLQLPLGAGTAFPVLPAARSAGSVDHWGPNDFSDLSIEQLMSLSVGGDERPEDEDDKTEDVEDESAEGEESEDEDSDAQESNEGSEGGEEDSAPDAGPGLFRELEVESVEWLSQEAEPSNLAAGRGFFSPGVATAGGFGSLRFGIGQPSLENQPVPTAVPPAPSDPIQTWFTPFAINLIDGTIDETWAVTDPVGTVVVSGAGGQVSYVLIDNAGGRFAIDGNSGEVTILAGPFDFTAQSSHSILVEVVDGANAIQRSFTIQVSPGDQDASGSPGDQVLTGANGNSDDQLYGGSGDDTLSGLNGDDGLHGGSGNDLLIGGNHDDTLYGGSDDDVLHGGNHADSLYGGTGDDRLYGENHADMLYGGGGLDQLYGGQHDDTLHGEGGDDWLDGGSGSDSLLGGADDDVLVWDAADLLIDGGDGDDELLVLAGDLDLTAFAGTLASIETVDLLSDSGANSLSLTVADVLDMTDNGLLTVLGDAQDSVVADAGWTLSQTDDKGYQLYIQTVGPDTVGLLLGPDVRFDPQDGG